jgi:hypothetical protein
MSFNVSQQKSEASLEDEGRPVPIHTRDEKPATYVKDGKELPVTITIVGSYSDRYRRKYNAQRKQMLAARRTEVSDKVDPLQVELVAHCIKSWEGLEDHDASGNVVPFPFTEANAIALLTACPWVRQELEVAMGDHAGFSKSSSSS